MIVRLMLAALFAVNLVGCASVIRGTIEQVQFDSEPPGATMRSIIKYECGGPCVNADQRPENPQAYQGVDQKTPEVPGPACITPCMAQVARNEELVVTFTKDGYEPQ